MTNVAQSLLVIQLREEIEKYARHDDDCTTELWHGKGPLECSCGLYQLQGALEAALAAQPPAAPVVRQHIGWLKQYIGGMDETNWKDMRLRAERQLEELCADLTPAAPVEPRHDSHAMLSQLDDASNACLELAAKHGFATGHGDTVADMIREFSAQIRTPSAPVETPDAEYVKAFVKALRVDPPHPSFSQNKKAADLIETLYLMTLGKPPCRSSAATAAEAQKAQFYGAQCSNYPACNGGCGLGCTKEAVSYMVNDLAAVIRGTGPCSNEDLARSILSKFIVRRK